MMYNRTDFPFFLVNITNLRGVATYNCSSACEKVLGLWRWSAREGGLGG